MTAVACSDNMESFQEVLGFVLAVMTSLKNVPGIKENIPIRKKVPICTVVMPSSSSMYTTATIANASAAASAKTVATRNHRKPLEYSVLIFWAVFQIWKNPWESNDCCLPVDGSMGSVWLAGTLGNVFQPK